MGPPPTARRTCLAASFPSWSFSLRGMVRAAARTVKGQSSDCRLLHSRPGVLTSEQFEVTRRVSIVGRVRTRAAQSPTTALASHMPVWAEKAGGRPRAGRGCGPGTAEPEGGSTARRLRFSPRGSRARLEGNAPACQCREGRRAWAPTFLFSSGFLLVPKMPAVIWGHGHGLLSVRPGQVGGCSEAGPADVPGKALALSAIVPET